VIVTPGGMNIYPDDLEAALRKQPKVKDCVVVGIERDGNAEPCAVLILWGDGRRENVKLEEVVKRAINRWPNIKRMRIWILWPQEDFPRTNTQKPRRNVIARSRAEAVAGAARRNWREDAAR